MDTDDQRLASLRATAHPLRLRMLSLLTGAPLSAAELARHLDVSQANASYHLRRLADADLVQLVEETSVRGGRAKRYRHVTSRDRRPDDTPPVGEAGAMVSALAGELTRRAELRAHDGGPSVTADAELWVDEVTWREVVDRVHAALADLHDAARPAGTPDTVRTSATVALFTLADPPGDDDAASP